MKVEYLNPFAEAASYVLKEVLFVDDIKRGKLGVHQGAVISSGVSAVIGITGQLRGHVIYDFSKEDALKVAGQMNGGEEFPGIDNIVRSTINELANMITGNASAKLSQGGWTCDITPPTLVVGKNSEVYAHKQNTHLIIPLETAYGVLHLSLAVTDQ